MKVVLNDDVLNLGDIGETVSVKPGYARNFLIPRGLAFEVGTASAGTTAHRMKQILAKKKKLKGSAEEMAGQIRDVEVELGLRVGSGGKVFGSIRPKDIADALNAQGVEIDRRRVLLDEPIRKVGTHFVSVKLHPEVQSQLKVTVNQLAATKEEEEIETRQAQQNIEEAADALAGEGNLGADGEIVEPVEVEDVGGDVEEQAGDEGDDQVDLS